MLKNPSARFYLRNLHFSNNCKKFRNVDFSASQTTYHKLFAAHFFQVVNIKVSVKVKSAKLCTTKLFV